MNNNPFRPEQPKIPGVLPTDEAKPEAAPPVTQIPSPAKTASMTMPPLWVILSASSVLVLCVFAVWWMGGASAKEKGSELATVSEFNPTPSGSAPAANVETMPTGPGEIATTDEMARTWSSKKFIFRDPLTTRTVPAMVVHLPGNVYWGFSLQEPYGTCEMEFVTDMAKLRTDYHYRGSHPMVGDPCNRAVFDLTRYGSGPGGLVRGEIAQGAAVRPPIAIEIQVHGKQVLAKKME